jgi:hypothetical protein
MKSMSSFLKQISESTKKSGISHAHHPHLGHYTIKKISDKHYALYDKSGDLKVTIGSKTEAGAIEMLRHKGYHVS